MRASERELRAVLRRIAADHQPDRAAIVRRVGRHRTGSPVAERPPVRRAWRLAGSALAVAVILGVGGVARWALADGPDPGVEPVAPPPSPAFSTAPGAAKPPATRPPRTKAPGTPPPPGKQSPAGTQSPPGKPSPAGTLPAPPTGKPSPAGTSTGPPPSGKPSPRRPEPVPAGESDNPASDNPTPGNPTPDGAADRGAVRQATLS